MKPKTLRLENYHEPVFVDADDYAYLRYFRWGLRRYGYNNYAACKGAYMHRVIMRAEPEQEVDHIDGNGLNNQKRNLRFVEHSENIRNSKLFDTNTSGFRGVSLRWDKRKWNAYISVNDRSVYLGCYETKEEAASAYEKARRAVSCGLSIPLGPRSLKRRRGAKNPMEPD